MVSDLDKVGMQIDINGNGVMDVFNPYLPVSYVRSKIQMPTKYSSNHEASFDFDVPADLVNPYFWVEDSNGKPQGYFYYFTQLGTYTWRVTLWGRFYYAYFSNGTLADTRPYWEEPLMRNDAYIIVGGYRG